MTVDIDQIIKSVPKNIYGDKKFTALKNLPMDVKEIIVNDMLTFIKLLVSVYALDRLPIIKIFIPYRKSLTCMEFVDLLWLVGHSSHTTYRTFPREEKNVIDTMLYLKDLVQIDSMNYQLLINLFHASLIGYD